MVWLFLDKIITSVFVESYVSDESYFNISNLVGLMAGNSLMPSRISRPIFKVCRQILSLCLTKLIARAHAANLEPQNCSSEAVRYIGNPHRFVITSWLNRGICVRSDNVADTCYKSFDLALKNLNSIHAAEHAGAASVLALIPTIGALLGAPTSEIWRLLTVVPFGSGLAMTLSFGGAILPVRVEDYANDLNRHKVTIERNVAPRAKGSTQSEDTQKEKNEGLNQVLDKIWRVCVKKRVSSWRTAIYGWDYWE